MAIMKEECSINFSENLRKAKFGMRGDIER